MRNSTGHLIRVEGVSPLILDWLSLRYKFEYAQHIELVFEHIFK
jgi:hypothetical protein